MSSTPAADGYQQQQHQQEYSSTILATPTTKQDIKNKPVFLECTHAVSTAIDEYLKTTPANQWSVVAAADCVREKFLMVDTTLDVEHFMTAYVECLLQYSGSTRDSNDPEAVTDKDLRAQEILMTYESNPDQEKAIRTFLAKLLKNL